MESNRAIVIGLCLLLLEGCPKAVPPEVVNSNARPVEVEQTKVDKVLTNWSLNLNDVSFENNRHVLEVGKTVHFSGDWGVIKSQVPYMGSTHLLLTLRPEEEGEEAEWDADLTRAHSRELKAPILQGKVARNVKIDEHYFIPGEYNAHLYYYVFDTVLGEGQALLIARSKVTLTEAKPAE